MLQRAVLSRMNVFNDPNLQESVSLVSFVLLLLLAPLKSDGAVTGSTFLGLRRDRLHGTQAAVVAVPLLWNVIALWCGLRGVVLRRWLRYRRMKREPVEVRPSRCRMHQSNYDCS